MKNSTAFAVLSKQNEKKSRFLTNSRHIFLFLFLIVFNKKTLRPSIHPSFHMLFIIEFNKEFFYLLYLFFFFFSLQTHTNKAPTIIKTTTSKRTVKKIFSRKFPVMVFLSCSNKILKLLVFLYLLTVLRQEMKTTCNIFRKMSLAKPQ